MTAPHELEAQRNHEAYSELMQTAAANAAVHALPSTVTELRPTVPAKKSTLPGDTGEAVVLIDAHRIGPSQYANRLEYNWTSAAFEELKGKIKEAGRNLQPVKVRPASAVSQLEYEVVYGHRRHRACLELGLPVHAVIETVSDRELVAQMVRENTGRLDCSPYERGRSYRLMLDVGLYPSLAQLAKGVGEDPSLLTKLLKLGNLPDKVVRAFRKPSDIQVRWGKDLWQALDEDRRRVLTRAEEIHALGKPTDPRQVLAALLPSPLPPAPESLAREIPIVRSGKKVGVIAVSPPAKGGLIRVEFFEAGVVEAKMLHDALMQLVSMQEP